MLVLGAWSLVIVGITTLLVAANRKQKYHECTELMVGIRGTGEKFYIEKDDIVHLVEKTANGSLVGKPVTAIDLARLEKVLERNSWIRNAELYFDSKDALHVKIEEREPVARVFTTEGASFYIDSAGHRMPLLEKLSARVPVITGFPDVRRPNGADSALFNDMKQVALFMYTHEFWNAQVGQIVITPERKFELIPVIGDHIIKLGDAANIGEKLNRLYVFYKQVLSKTGFNKYAAIDVAYDGQVVAIKKGPVSAVDSIQLQKNIEELMNKASLQNVEAEMLPSQNAGPVSTEVTTNKAGSIPPTAGQQSGSVSINKNPAPENQEQSTPLKATIPSKPNDNRKNEVKNEKPKAVMQKRVVHGQ